MLILGNFYMRKAVILILVLLCAASVNLFAEHHAKIKPTTEAAAPVVVKEKNTVYDSNGYIEHIEDNVRVMWS